MLLQQKQEFLNKDRPSYDSQKTKGKKPKGWIFLKNEESTANRLKVLLLPVPCQHFCLLKMTGMPLLCWRQQMAQCAFPQGGWAMYAECVLMLSSQAGLTSEAIKGFILWLKPQQRGQFCVYTANEST